MVIKILILLGIVFLKNKAGKITRGNNFMLVKLSKVDWMLESSYPPTGLSMYGINYLLIVCMF